MLIPPISIMLHDCVFDWYWQATTEPYRLQLKRHSLLLMVFPISNGKEMLSPGPALHFPSFHLPAGKPRSITQVMHDIGMFTYFKEKLPTKRRQAAPDMAPALSFHSFSTILYLRLQKLDPVSKV